MKKNDCHHLHPVPFAVACGAIWGVGLLLLAWVSLWSGGQYGNKFIMMTSSFYLGYANTWVGGIYGLLWGFADWFIGGLILAWLYNCFCCKHDK